MLLLRFEADSCERFLEPERTTIKGTFGRGVLLRLMGEVVSTKVSSKIEQNRSDAFQTAYELMLSYFDGFKYKIEYHLSSQANELVRHAKFAKSKKVIKKGDFAINKGALEVDEVRRIDVFNASFFDRGFVTSLTLTDEEALSLIKDEPEVFLSKYVALLEETKKKVLETKSKESQSSIKAWRGQAISQLLMPLTGKWGSSFDQVWSCYRSNTKRIEHALKMIIDKDDLSYRPTLIAFAVKIAVSQMLLGELVQIKSDHGIYGIPFLDVTEKKSDALIALLSCQKNARVPSLGAENDYMRAVFKTIDAPTYNTAPVHLEKFNGEIVLCVITGDLVKDREIQRRINDSGVYFARFGKQAYVKLKAQPLVLPDELFDHSNGMLME